MDIAGVDVEIDVIRELPELEDLEVNSSTEDQSFSSSKYGFKNVIIKGVQGEKLDLNPSLEQQNVKGVFTEVNINPIQTEKLSAVPTTQEQVLTGLFDEVTVNAIEGQELNLNPSEEQQNYEGVFLGVNINPIQVEEIETDLDFSSGDAIELKAQEGAYIKKATINKDANLTPENIKSGVSIAGISGEVADTSDADATSDDIISGKTAYVGNEKIAGTYIPLDTSDATATAEDIAKGKTAYVNGVKVIGNLEGSVSPDTNYLATVDPKSGIKVTALPEGATTIQQYLYYYNTNVEIDTIPASVRKIGQYAFADTAVIYSKTLTIEGDIDNIGTRAFSNAGYQTIVMGNVTKVPTLLNVNAFEYISNKYSTIYVPDSLLSTFKAASPWYNLPSSSLKAISELG